MTTTDRTTGTTASPATSPEQPPNARRGRRKLSPAGVAQDAAASATGPAVDLSALPPPTTQPAAEPVGPAETYQPVEAAQPPGGTTTSKVTKPTKVGQLVTLLAAPEGATLAQLCAALGWQAHTVRAALTRLRQAGHAVERSRAEDGQTVYRIGTGQETEPAGAAEGAMDAEPSAATATDPRQDPAQEPVAPAAAEFTPDGAAQPRGAA